MKKHNALKVVLVSLVLFLILSWIIPAAYYSGQFMDQGRVQMGLFDFFEYPLTAISYFGYIPVFLLFVGGFYGVLYKIPAYRNLLDKVAAKGKAHNILTITLIVSLLALGVSICGLQIGLALFIPFLVSVLLLMGYEKKMVAYTLVGAMTAGFVGTTYASQNVGLALSALSLNFDYQIGVRFILLAVSVFLVVLNVLLTVKKQEKVVVEEIKLESNKKEEKVEEKVVVEVEEPVKNTETKAPTKKATTKGAGKNAGKNTKGKSTGAKGKSSKNGKGSKSKNANKAALKDGDVIIAKHDCGCCNCLVPAEVQGNKKTWPISLIFGLLFILMILAFIPWGETGFKVTFFTELTKNVQEFELFGFPIFAKLLGTIVPFGEWGINQLFFPCAFGLLLIVVIYGVKFNEVLDGFVAGMKKAVAPALVSIAMYTALVIVTYHPFQLTIYKAILGLTKGFNIATTALVAFLASIFNSDPIYTAQSYLPYYVSVVTNADNYPLAAVIYQTIYGFTTLVAPTSLVLMATLSYLKVNYLDWLKTVWKLILELFVILLIIFIVLALV